MTFDSPNSTPNLNPSFHPLITNFAFPSPLDLPLYHHHFPITSSVHETLIVGEMGAPGFCAPPASNSKAPMKKGRHSKIQTSQGLRDRRVRLSIGIARQFFDLQDMLGFDKASKTLDWLLSRSKNAIIDLARNKHQSDCHVATGQTDSIGSNGDHAVNNNDPENLQGVSKEEKKKKKTIPRARKKKICCGKPTSMNQSALATASTSTSTSTSDQKNNNYYFPNLALDWDDGYNPVLPPSSFVVSNMNLSETGFDAQREYTMY